MKDAIDELRQMFGARAVAYMMRWTASIRSADVARAMGVSSKKARGLLDKAVALGLLERSERYSYVNCRAWKLPGASDT